MTVTAKTEGSGARAYRVIVTLRESGGAPATITAIELAFMEGATLSIAPNPSPGSARGGTVSISIQRNGDTVDYTAVTSLSVRRRPASRPAD
jgi:hypothetical protein